nr:hypothetical protein BaRGS_017239 [Batillaria attramentaria]
MCVRAFDGQLRQASQYPTQSSRILMDNVACTGTENRLLDCIYSSTHNCNHNEDVALMCYVTGADCDFEGPCPFEDISQGGFSWRPVLVTPPISRNATETCTLTFWYHMYGQDIGTLSIYTANPVQLSSKTRLWRLTGDQGGTKYRF